MKTARIVAACSLLLTGWALAAKPAPAPSAPTPAQLVALRQAGMDMSATSLNLLKGGSANGIPLKNLAFSAAGLARWADAMPALFSDSTRALTSRALPDVWAKKADFAAKAATFSQAAKALADAAKAEDKDAFAAALASTGAACKGCHDSFQAPAQPPKAG